MSYARFGWGGSDIYMFLHVDGFIDCCGCLLQEREHIDDPASPLGFRLRPTGKIIRTSFHSTDEALEHLQEHMKVGHNVPVSCVEALEADRASNDEFIKRGGRSRE